MNNWTIFNEGFMRDIARKRLLKIQSNYTKFLHSCGSFQVIDVKSRVSIFNTKIFISKKNYGNQKMSHLKKC